MSGDTVEELKKFHDKYQLNFLLAGDTGHQTLDAYGVWQEKNMYGVKKMGIVRTTYIIDGKGKVKNVFPRVQVNGHIQEVLAALKAKE
jgi:thioredoxin-dependent peroxiredoxin